jgi:hypothetical protein
MTRRAALAVTIGIAVLVCGCGTSDRSGIALRWAPPKLQEAQTIVVGPNRSSVSLATDQDYRLRLPPRERVGGLEIEGGHDVVLIGGAITIPRGTPPGQENDRFRNGIYVKGTTGTVHIEGVAFDARPGVEWDAVAINAPRAIVQIENIRADGVRGTYDRFHGDVVQSWGGVRELRIDRLTASSNYQGLTISAEEGPIGSAKISNVDLRASSRGADRGGHMLWLTSGSESCDSYPVELRDVYVMPRVGYTFGHSVWPETRFPRACRADEVDGFVDWPQLPNIDGGVRMGTPPSGPYVAKGVVGPGYRSPGYAGASG